MDRNKLLIGAYYFDKSLFDDAHVKAAADMGIDFLVSVPADKALLDLCEKYGLGTIISGEVPAWWGDGGQKAGQYKDTLDLGVFDGLKKSYTLNSHPAVWGDYPVDEPNAKDFGHIDAMIKKYRRTFPGKLPFVNLYPNYASVLPSADSDAMSQLGTTTYREHVERYAREVEDDYICFDSYPYGSRFAGYLENLDDVSSVCRETGKDMWVIIQTGAWKAEALLDEYQLFWQANLCLAYGAKIIMHASYYHGWWEPSTSCVDAEGRPNSTYYHAKSLNSALRSLSEVYMQYNHIGVSVCGDLSRTESKIKEQLERQAQLSPCRGIEGVAINADGAVIAGCFEKKDGAGGALMLVNTEDPFSAEKPVNIFLDTCGCKKLTAYRRGASVTFNGSCRLTIPSGEGIFITAE